MHAIVHHRFSLISMVHIKQSECDTVIVHFPYVCTSQLSEDVKASCVSYGRTSTIHSRGGS